MYKFKINFKNGQIQFESPKDQELFSSLAKNAELAHAKLELTISEYVSQKGTTEKQFSLFNYMCKVLSDEAGLTMREARESFLAEVFGSDEIVIEDLTNEEFSKLITSSVTILQTYFNIPIEYNEETGLYQLNR